jgi:hypothetical protein
VEVKGVEEAEVDPGVEEVGGGRRRRGGAGRRFRERRAREIGLRRK